VGSKDDNASDDTCDSGNASDNGGHVKIGAEAALASISYDFGWSKVTRGRVSDLENSIHFFLKGFAQPPGVESVLVPKENEVVLFEDFFSLPAFAYLYTQCFWIYFTNFMCNCINSHPMLLCKSASLFGMLLLAEVILMLRFLLITMSYITRTRRFILKGPRLPSLHSLGAYIFTHLGLGIALGLLPLRGTSGLVAGIATSSTYPLSSKMTPLVHEMDVSSSCSPEDAHLAAFIQVTSLIGGRDAVEEFLASGLWPLGQQFGFEVEMKESPLSKVILSMPWITTAIGQRESEATFLAQIQNATNELVGRYNITEQNAYQGLWYG
jgi:hypothetical protein